MSGSGWWWELHVQRLRLAHGTYDLAGATWELNASTAASEIRLIGDGDVTIDPPPTEPVAHPDLSAVLLDGAF